MSGGFQVFGNVEDAAFTLKIHRGEGMALLAMNWRKGQPPPDFVGFAIEYREPERHTLLCGQESPELQRQRRLHIEFEATADLLNIGGAYPEIPVGPLSAKRRLSR